MIAHARYIRMSPRKIRLVANIVRGMAVPAAETQLTVIRKAAAVPLMKVLQSAVANAVDQYDGDRDDLIIETIMVDAAPMLKRSRPRAFGRASPIHKRGAHITIVLKSTKPLKRKERIGITGETVVATEAPKESAMIHDQVTAENGRSLGAHTEDVKDPRKMGSRSEPSHKRSAQKKSKGFLKTLFSRKTG